MTKLYRVVAYVLDLNGNAPTKEDVVDQIFNNRYPEYITVKDVRETEVGEWSDDHPLNKTGCDYKPYFPEIYPGPLDVNLKDSYEFLKGKILTVMSENEKLENEIYELKTEIESLKKVQEFVKTVKDLTK